MTKKCATEFLTDAETSNLNLQMYLTERDTIDYNGWLSRIRQWTFRLRRGWGISWLAKERL